MSGLDRPGFFGANPNHQPGNFGRVGLLGRTFSAIDLQAMRWSAELLFQDFCVAYGEAKARQEWQKLAKKPPGRPKGKPRDAARDAKLLEIYDMVTSGLSDAQRKPLTRKLSELLHERSPGQFALSTQAIEKKIRRLTKDREAQRQRLSALYNLGAGLLGGGDKNLPGLLSAGQKPPPE